MTTASPRRSTRTTASVKLIAAALLAGGAAQPGAAEPATSAPDAVVTAHAQHYRWAGQSFDSLDALEATVLPRAPRSLALVACGSSATPALPAAAHRFRHLELHLGTSEAGVGRCEAERQEAAASTVQRVALREGARPSRIDEAAVRTWWEQVMP